MAFEAGNKFWEARSSHGRKPIFESPEQLWNAAIEYFEWNEANPLWETKSYMYQGVPVQDHIPKMRAMTKEGLCNYLDISIMCWNSYRDREDFSYVATRVEEIIRRQKFEGAAAEFLNPNIIARDLGLADKKDNTHDVSDALKEFLTQIDGSDTGLPDGDR
jgi:hypothetical protein